MRYWTSDWHINSEIVRRTSRRPWKTAEEMNCGILGMTYRNNIGLTDQIIHVGDLIQSGKDRGTEIAKDKQLKWDQIVRKCACMLFCVEGNHDASNGVPFACRSMKARVGNYGVTVGHYPTWFKEADGTFVPGATQYYAAPEIHICGHVHGSWKVAYDPARRNVNVNVGIDAHGYRLLSDADLVELIDRAIAWWKHLDTSADTPRSCPFDKWEKDIANRKRLEAEEKKARTMAWLKVNRPDIYAARVANMERK